MRDFRLSHLLLNTYRARQTLPTSLVVFLFYFFTVRNWLRIVSSTQDTVPLCFRSTLGIARGFVSFWEQFSKLEFFLQFDTSLPCSCPVLPSYQVFSVSPPHTWRRYVMVIAPRKVTTPVWRTRICIKEGVTGRSPPSSGGASFLPNLHLRVTGSGIARPHRFTYPLVP